MALEFLKKVYYFLEDKYYALLDKLNRAIPVYKIVDPIDKHFPSFIIFSASVFLLLFLLLFFAVPGLFAWLFPGGGVGPFPAKIRVLDEDEKTPVKDANVTVVFSDSNKSVSKSTDKDGFAVFELPSKEAKVSLEIRAGGYENLLRSNVTLSSEKVSSFALKRGAILFKPKVKIKVFDFVSKDHILDRTISIKFSCSGSSTISLPAISGTQNALVPFEVEVPEGCGTLHGTVQVDGYTTVTQLLTSGYEGREVKFYLNRSSDEPQKKGSLSVQVLDNLGSPAAGISVKITNESTNAYVATDFTKESGSVVFNDLNPGKYVVLADAGDGRTATQKDIQVVSGQTANVSLRLPSFAGHVKKLHVKVVDANKGLPIGGAQVIIYMGGVWLKSVDTNADGTALVWVGPQDVSKSFTARVSAHGYILKIVSIPVLDYSDASPTIVSLLPEVSGQNFRPIAIFTAKPYAGNVPLLVEFDASQSFDPEGAPIVSYEWDLGDGNTAGTVKKTHTYYKDSNYEVILRVRDDKNAVGSMKITIQVLASGQNSAPIALFTMKPYYGFAPLSVDFNAEASFDYDGSIQSYQWDFGDNSSGTGKKVSHTYNKAGEYTIELVVVDDKSAKNKLSAKLQVFDKVAGGNIRPVAFIAVENNAYYGAVPFKVSFDASASYDPDGSITNYKWDFGDGSATAIEEGQSKAKVSHTFAKTGVFKVMLEIKDNNNATATQSVSIQVVQGPSNWKPVALLDANVYHGKIPLEVAFSALKSFDPDGSIVFYKWNFGDGSAQEEGLNKGTVKHVFSAAGDFTVLLTVQDDDGAVATDSVIIQAYSSVPVNLKPVALFDASTYFGVKPLTVAFDASPSFDPDGVISSYAWNFGDGGTASGKTATHVFNAVGEFTVELKVKDGKGAEGVHSAKIQVAGTSTNLNPVPKITASGLFGQKPFTVDFSAEGSFDPDGSIQSYQWNFGDGSTANTQKVSHKFETAGLFEVKLTVKDNSNNSATASVFVQVVDWPVQTNGSILAKTESFSGQPVQSALLHLYREDSTIPLTDPASPVYSGPGGTHLFEKIPASISKYYLKAFYDPNLSGESLHKHVVPSSTIELKAVLSSKQGKIAAKVLKNGNPVQGATVSFLKASDSSVIGSCATSADGNCLSPAIQGGERVKVRAQKTGSLTAESSEIEIIADNIHSVVLELHDAPPSGIQASFVMACEDSQCNSPAPSIISLPSGENHYYFKFDLLLAADTSQNTRFAVVAGDFAQEALPVSNYRIKIVDVLDNSLTAKLLATCFNKANVFETVPACTGGGASFKHSVSVWDSLSAPGGLSKTIVLKVAIEPGLAAGTATEIRFAARAKQNNKDVNADLTALPILIGAPICSGGQKLVWSGHIVVDGAKIVLPIDPPPEKFVALKKNSDYNVFFTVKNCTNQAISSLKITVLNEKDNNCISFPGLGGAFGPYEVITIPSLVSGGVSEEKRIEIKAVKTTDQTILTLSGKWGAEESAHGMFFKVLSDKNFLVEGLPNFLVKGVPVVISGKVLDAQNSSPVSGAVVQILLNSALLVEVQSDSNGNFSFTQSSGTPPASGDKVTVKIRKAGYSDFLKEIPVTSGGSVSLIDCIKIEPKTAIPVAKGANGSFDVITANCPKKMTVLFASQLSLPLKTVTLNETDAKTVSFSATGTSIFQGIYPIVVKGFFEGASYERHIGIVDVAVTDPNACISMDKFEFDLLAGSAAAIIKNKCFVENRSTEYPLIVSSNAGVTLKKTDPKDNIPESVSFSWKINSFAKQEGGNDFSVKAMEKSVTVKPSESLVFEIDSFNAADYINGNSPKGIVGLKQSPNYGGGLLLEAWFVPITTVPEVEVWIEGSKVIGKYHGPLETTGSYPISISNKYLVQTEYSTISAEDLVRGGGG